MQGAGHDDRAPGRFLRFDQRTRYGGQDREFGERLETARIRGKRIRHRAIVGHLDHPRGYATEESLAFN
ncbi:hypothetical protein ACW7GZ_08990 [Luteimonas sp. A537]